MITQIYHHHLLLPERSRRSFPTFIPDERSRRSLPPTTQYFFWGRFTYPRSALYISFWLPIKGHHLPIFGVTFFSIKEHSFYSILCQSNAIIELVHYTYSINSLTIKYFIYLFHYLLCLLLINIIQLNLH